MIIKVNKTFLKELAAIPTKERIKIEGFLFEEMENYVLIFERLLHRKDIYKYYP